MASSKNELKPWLKKQRCIPQKGNAEFVWKMEDVLEVYKRRYDHEYRRNGVANLFMLFEPLGGKRHVKVTERRTKKD